MLRRGLIQLAAMVAALALAAPAAARTPQLFHGVAAAGYPSAPELQTASRAGVRTLRFHFAWGLVEGSPGVRSWGLMDQVIGDAARANIQALPMLYGTTGWVSPNAAAPPIYSAEARNAWSAFLAEAASRYGANGSFWALHPELPRLPIIDWQVWNEVNLGYFWGGPPSAGNYLTLVRLSRAALRAGDPSARIIAAGLIPFKSAAKNTVSGQKYIRKLFRQRGAAKLFDAIAIHPYGARPNTVMKSLGEVRRLLNSLNARRLPIWVTEFGWTTRGSGWGKAPVRATEAQQAKWVAQTYRLMRQQAKSLRLRRGLYFSLKDGGTSGAEEWPTYMGLLKGDGQPKPAWFAYARAAGGSP